MNPRVIEISFKLLVVAGACWVLMTAMNVVPDQRGYGTHEDLGMEPCGYLERNGHPCATCGMTTAFSHTVRLQLPRAFLASPAGMLLCLLTIAVPAWVIHSLLTGESALRFLLWPYGRLLPVVLFLLIIASWLYKIAAFTPPQ
jgi:hypothetical protein